MIPHELLYDPLRRAWVKATPEEKVRQQLLATMTRELGYPPSLIVIEAQLASLPHLAGRGLKLPQRRIDILCYGTGPHAAYPLIAIECKAGTLGDAVRRQIVGYNHYVGAPFIAYACPSGVYTGYWEGGKGEYDFVPRLMSYAELQAAL